MANNEKIMLWTNLQMKNKCVCVCVCVCVYTNSVIEMRLAFGWESLDPSLILKIGAYVTFQRK